MRDVKIRELLDGIELQTDEEHRLRVLYPKLFVRLPIDPANIESWDDRFILTMTRAGTKRDFVLTVKDDHTPGDAYVDLIFKHLMPDARYTLTIDPGADGPLYEVFTDRPHDELFTL